MRLPTTEGSGSGENWLNNRGEPLVSSTAAGYSGSAAWPMVPLSAVVHNVGVDIVVTRTRGLARGTNRLRNSQFSG